MADSNGSGIGGLFKRLFGKGAAKPVPPSKPKHDPVAEMLAWSKAKAKQADDAHKARIRAHVERPIPPTTDEDRKSLALAAPACLAIRHVFPPRHPQRSMSFLGGVPLGPDSLDYPMVHNRQGLLEPLTFMGQIDLSTLPDGGGRALLPKQGYLYFFAPMSWNFDETAYHFGVRYVADKVSKSWGPQEPVGMLSPIEGVENARYLFSWMNWQDRPEKAYPRFFLRIEIELGWVDDGGEVEDGDPDAAHGFPWDVAVERYRASLMAFHGAPIPYDPVLSPHDKPTDRLWIPFEGFPTNRRAAEIVLGFLKTYLKEEMTAIEAQAAKLAAEDPEKAELQAWLRQYQDFDRRHRIAMQHINIAVAERGKPLAAEARAAILDLLEQVRAGELPKPFVERTYIQKRLPMVLNEWLSVAAVESIESALGDPNGADQIPPQIVEAVRYRHSVLKGGAFSEHGHFAQHQMLGRGRVIQTAGDEMAQQYILLLQLSPDEALGWRMGDAGALQYWIHPADLAACRFENTVLTFECH